MQEHSKPERDARLFPLYKELYSLYGSQYWWPGDTPFEIMVGAILTQNTNWRNVERAIENLKEAAMMDPHALWQNRYRIAKLIKPSGFYRIKTRRLTAFIRSFIEEYDGHVDSMKRKRTNTLRQELTGIHGIGYETADSILLYALERPVFVVDAYTRRIGARHDLYESDVPYDVIRNLFENSLPKNVKIYNEYHALLVKIGKDFCRKNEPLCDACPVQRILPS
jgi:endonuclease-3 related protein